MKELPYTPAHGAGFDNGRPVTRLRPFKPRLKIAEAKNEWRQEYLRLLRLGRIRRHLQADLDEVIRDPSRCAHYAARVMPTDRIRPACSICLGRRV